MLEERIRWRAIGGGLMVFLLVWIELKLFEGLVFSALPYDSRALGWFLSVEEVQVQGYTAVMLVGYVFIYVVQTAIPSIATAWIAKRRQVLHASIVVLITTACSWVMFGAVRYHPASECAGLAFSLLIAVFSVRVFQALCKSEWFMRHCSAHRLPPPT